MITAKQLRDEMDKLVEAGRGTSPSTRRVTMSSACAGSTAMTIRSPIPRKQQQP